MLYAILIIFLVIFILLFVLPGVIVFILIKTNVMKLNIFTDSFNAIMERMMSGASIDMKSSKDTNVAYKEALAILGLDANPSISEINKAYHKLMISNHPDKGGSSYLAQKINSARDVLLAKYKQKGV